MTIFSKKKFKQNADRSTKKILSRHLDALDGKPVVPLEGYKYKQVEHYEFEGEDWYLYPVMPEWCEEVGADGN